MTNTSDTNQEGAMPNTFQLADIDIDIDEVDRSEWYIEIREVWSDGTSESYVVWEPDSLQQFLLELKEAQDEGRLERLTPEQRERYDRFEKETVCRCDGSCGVICWFDLQDRDYWLDEVAPLGADIEWVWMFGDDIRGPQGASYLSEFNTFSDEGPGLAGEIWRQVDWY